MTKIIKEVVLEEYASFDGKTLREMKQYVDLMIETHGASAWVSISKDYRSQWDDHESVCERICGKREETDEEYTKRLDDEQARKNIQEKHEHEQYEALQKKFGGKK